MQYNPNGGYDMPGSGKCVMEYAMRLFALRAAAKNVNCNVAIHPGRPNRRSHCTAGHGRHAKRLGRGRCVDRRRPTGSRGACGAWQVVVPGVTDTDAWGKLAATRGTSKDDLVAGIASRLSLMGAMTPRQLGDAVAFLCSPQGRLVTGVSLPVDGGVHLKA